MPTLFDPARLSAFAQEHAPPVDECVRKLKVLGKLLERDRTGLLTVLGERRVEQSFNERILAELFDYRTLFRSGAGDYHVDPQSYNPATGKYPDFKLGFFGAGTQAECRVSGELKAFGANLDAPQSGSYSGLSPVQQAFQAIGPNPVERWVILCNYDEIRLYSSADQSRYEKFSLMSTDTVEQFRRLHSLFSCRTLLGQRDSISLLDLLLQDKICMHVPQTGSPRLLHQATFRGLEHVPRSFGQLEDAILSSLEYVQSDPIIWPRVPPGANPFADEDVLRIRHVDDDGRETIVEVTRTPSLRVAEYAPLTNDTIHDAQKQRIYPLDVAALAARIGRFIVLTQRFFRGLRPETEAKVEFHWELDGIGGAQCMNIPSGWAQSRSLSVQTNVKRSNRAHPGMGLNVTGEFRAARQGALATVSEQAIRELLFSFQKELSNGGRVARVRPQPGSVIQFYRSDALIAQWLRELT